MSQTLTTSLMLRDAIARMENILSEEQLDAIHADGKSIRQMWSHYTQAANLDPSIRAADQSAMRTELLRRDFERRTRLPELAYAKRPDGQYVSTLTEARFQGYCAFAYLEGTAP